MSELSRKQCFKTYIEYKRACEIVYSDIKCDIKGIEKMNREELNEYVKKIQQLYIKSGVCARLRKVYRDLCITEEKRDEGHDYAIEKASKYEIVCEKVLEKIGERYNELRKEDKPEREQGQGVIVKEEKKTSSPKKVKKSPKKEVLVHKKVEEDIDFEKEMEKAKEDYKQHEDEIERIYDEFLEKLGEVQFDDKYLYNLFIFYVNNKWKKAQKVGEFVNFDSKEDLKIVKKIVKEPLDKILVNMIVANFEIESIKTDTEARQFISEIMKVTPYKEYIGDEKIDKKRMEDIIKEVISISTVFLVKDSEYKSYLMEYMHTKELVTHFIPKIIIHKALFAVVKRRYAKSPYWFTLEKNKMENVDEQYEEIKEETIRSAFMKSVNKMKRSDWVSAEKLLSYMINYALEEEYKTNFITESVRNRFIKDKREKKLEDLSKWEKVKVYNLVREGDGWMIGFIAKYVK